MALLPEGACELAGQLWHDWDSAIAYDESGQTSQVEDDIEPREGEIFPAGHPGVLYSRLLMLVSIMHTTD